MASTYKAFLNKMGGTSATGYIGKEGELFFDPTTTTLRISDGSTPGGTVVSAGGGDTGDITFVGNTISSEGAMAIEASESLTVAYTDGSTSESVFYAEQGLASITVIDSGTPGAKLQLNSSNVAIDNGQGSDPIDLTVSGNVSSNGIVLSANNIITGNADGIFVSSNNFSWTFFEYGLMRYPVLTWADISGAVEAGQRVFISDSSLEATAANFGEIVTGGGSNTAPVWSDGSYWRIG